MKYFRVQGSIPGTFLILINSPRISWGKFHYAHFTNKKTETHRIELFQVHASSNWRNRNILETNASHFIPLLNCRLMIMHGTPSMFFFYPILHYLYFKWNSLFLFAANVDEMIFWNIIRKTTWLHYHMVHVTPKCLIFLFAK